MFKNSSISQISRNGFILLIISSILSGSILLFLLFSLENINNDVRVSKDIQNLFLKVKTNTQLLLTSSYLKESESKLYKSIDDFNKLFITHEFHTKIKYQQLKNDWYVCTQEINKIRKLINNKTFTIHELKNKPLLVVAGEQFNLASSTQFYSQLTVLIDSIEYLLQNETFMLNSLHKLDIKHNLEQKQQLEEIKSFAIISMVVFFIFLILVTIYTLQIIFKNEQQLEATSKALIEKEKMLAQQSKMASMGEMLENIAHQWRQPLSVISTASSGIIMQKEFGNLTDKEEIESLSIITNSAQHLSQTIDDFRDFFKEHKEKRMFNLKDIYRKTISLLDSKFKNREIEVIEDICDIEVYSLDSELIQAIMNILNNARDVLETKSKGEKKLIFIDICKENSNAIIKIKDNGGGISNNIIHKVFEPYFTTKHKSQGTGIGLYMSEEMIRKHMHGSLDVKNEEYNYENKLYKGACFTITLPLSKDIAI